MRLGCCGQIESAGVLKDAGFDFLEVSAANVLRGDEASATWDPAAPDVKRLPLPIEAANILVPASRPIVGPGRDEVGLQDYIQRVAKRAERLGIRVLVFGSAAARKRPEGVDGATADRQIEAFVRMAGQVCAHHGVTLVVEHLASRFCNTINTLADEMALVRRVNLPNVAALLDNFHMTLEGQTDQAVLSLGPALCHVHICEPVDQLPPGGHEGSDKAFDFVHFFRLLREIGYDGRVSVEAKWQPSPESARASASYLRQAWGRANRS